MPCSMYLKSGYYFVDFLSQVLGFAAFFALVLKKVDQEEYGDAKFEGELRNPGTLSSS